ncbi:hypothetical protein L1N85_19780 [Paenibacillus alkaliterrae]|uniref:hypothetical protein n=1 Tax=Paenibacillus alkaliterrae TaxID=320909 RepID=UPI001F476E95|nr:hypothetical protein [Paenibacillus alkaliterrae]MCF2940637.1 hypothetical protein [Paenibacillus alkaliterrae]
MRFDKGDAVMWPSEPGGIREERRGTFIVRIPPQIDYRPFLPPETPNNSFKTDMPRSEIDRALVQVLQDDGKPYYYTPRFSQLRKIDGSTNSTS